MRSVPSWQALCSATVLSGKHSSGHSRCRRGRGPFLPGRARCRARDQVEHGGPARQAATRPARPSAAS
eukprot:8118182-Lingulodinium_polyedra.AAC.1